MSIAEPKSIDIDNVGAIGHLSFPILEEGGVFLATGPNGSGKSTALLGVRALYDPSVRPGLNKSDAAPSGKIAAPGLEIRLGKVNTKKGELEVVSIDCDCDPSKLVDPGIQNPAAADRERTRILIRMRGIKIDRERWANLLAGVKRAGLAEEMPEELDAVGQAAFIKKKLNDDALTLEKEGKAKESTANGLREAVKDVPRDRVAVPESSDSIAELIADAKRKRTAKAEAEASTAEAREKLTKIDGEGRDLDAEHRAAIKAESQAWTSLQVVVDEILELEKRLDSLRGHEKVLSEKHTSATRERASAEERLRVRNETAALLESLVPSAPSDEELADLERRKANAKAIEDANARVAEAAAQRAKADAVYEEARVALNSAEDLRTLAKRTDEVIAEALATSGIEGVSVNEGRLCVATDRSPTELFGELSSGEKWSFAIGQVAARLNDAPEGSARLVSIEQPAWEGLDPKNRRLVYSLSKQYRVNVYSAVAGEGELRVEEYAGGAV